MGGVLKKLNRKNQMNHRESSLELRDSYFRYAENKKKLNSDLLIKAISNQNIDIVNILIFAGSNLEIGDVDGNTPLMIGVKIFLHLK